MFVLPRRRDIFFPFSQAMVGKAAEACPTLLSPGSAPLSELRELAETKAAARLPPDFAKNLVAATLGVELTNKVTFCITTKETRSLYYCFAAQIICVLFWSSELNLL
jgi:hypothetical protein